MKKALTNPKSKFEVAIMEYEAGWGSRVDEVKGFDTLEEAEAFIKKFNQPNVDDYAKTKTVPSWYMTARLVSDY